MVPLYAVLAAPLVRPLGDPARALVHALEGTLGRPRGREGVHGRRLRRRAVVSAPVEEGARDRARDRRRRVLLQRRAGERRAGARARARPLLAGEGARDGPARRRARGRRHGSRRTARPATASTTRTSASSSGSRRSSGSTRELGGPVPRAEIPALFARSDVLVNNMRAGAPDKVVYEAAASCLPVLASNPVFDDLLPPRAPLRPRRPGEPRRAAADARPPPPARAARARVREPLGRALGGRRAGYR